jgi:phage baseplate assembly protein W
MPEPDTTLRHLAFPLRARADGSFEQVEQDTYEDVRQCVYMVLRTPLQSRPLAPHVGVDDPTFSMGVDAPELEAQLQELEPRAVVKVTAGDVESGGEQQVEVRVALAADDEGDEQEDHDDDDEAVTDAIL